MPGEVADDGSGEIIVNRYSSNPGNKCLSFYNEMNLTSCPTSVPSNVFEEFSSWGFLQNVADGYFATSFNYSAAGATANGSLSIRYLTQDLYEDMLLLLSAEQFVSGVVRYKDFTQPDTANNSNTTPTPIAFTELPNNTYYPTFSIREGYYTNENQASVDATLYAGNTLNKVTSTQIVAFHFRRKAVGGGTTAYPTGKIKMLSMQKAQFGSKTGGAVAWYSHFFSVPTNHVEPSYPQTRLPSSGSYVSTTSYSLTNEHAFQGVPSEIGYYIINQSATPPDPETPAVDLGGSRQPAVTKVAPNIRYDWNHGEPYLTFEIYRNTTNNSGTATLIATVSNDNPTVTEEFIWGFTYTDTGPFSGGTTYYYWHKCYYDISRKSGFSIVKSVTF
jgi:hypothetical protein